MTLLRHGDSYLYFRSYLSFLSIEQLKCQLEKLNDLRLTTPIYLILNTGGGNLKHLTDLYELMVTSRRPIYTIVDQEVREVGSLMALLGKKRMMVKGSTITLPNMLTQEWDEEMLEAYGNLVYQIYRKYSKMSEETRYQMMRQECRIESREALELGLVDEMTQLPEAYQESESPLGGGHHIGGEMPSWLESLI